MPRFNEIAAEEILARSREVLSTKPLIADNTAGPITVATRDDAYGSINIYVARTATGVIYSQVPFVKRAGVLVLGTPVNTIFSGVTPITSLTVSVGNQLVITLVGANSNVRVNVLSFTLS